MVWFNAKQKITIPGPTIDQEALAKRYQVVQKGAQAGRHNNPSSPTSEPGADEQTIEGGMHEEHRILTAAYVEQIKSIYNQQLKLAEHTDPQRLLECAANAEQEFWSHTLRRRHKHLFPLYS